MRARSFDVDILLGPSLDSWVAGASSIRERR